MATWSKAASLIVVVAVIFLISSAGVAHGGRRSGSGSGRRLVSSYDEPCKKMRLYLHDIIYDYSNSTSNSTSAAVTKPTALGKTVPGKDTFFGRMVVFDDPMTEDEALPPPGKEAAARAQGFFFLDKKETLSAWLAFSILFNSTEHKGTLNLMGADPDEETRDISVVGGTGDFFMARGIATLRTSAVEGFTYFRVQMDIKLYECYV